MCLFISWKLPDLARAGLAGLAEVLRLSGQPGWQRARCQPPPALSTQFRSQGPATIFIMIIILIFDVDPDYWFQMMPDVDNVVGVMTQCLSGAGCRSVGAQPEDAMGRSRSLGCGPEPESGEGLRWKLTGTSSLARLSPARRGSAHTFDSEPGPSLSQSSSGSETEDTHRRQS